MKEVKITSEEIKEIIRAEIRDSVGEALVNSMKEILERLELKWKRMIEEVRKEAEAVKEECVGMIRENSESSET